MDFSDKTLSTPQYEDDRKKGKKKEKYANKEFSEYEKSLLLNFKYNDYHQPNEQYRPARPKTLSVREKKKLKQNYLQGNFRFFISDVKSSICGVCIIRIDMDPNQEVKWDKVVMLKYITNNVIMCPICLSEHYEIKVPKMTKCGHIYCWPCIVKYLSYQKPKCPLCEEIVLLDDLRSVQIVHFPAAHPGDKMLFKLKKRRKVENIIYDAADFNEEEDFIRVKKVYYDTIKDIKEGEKTILYNLVKDLTAEDDKDTKATVEKCIVFLGEELEELEKKAVTWMPRPKKMSKEYSQHVPVFNEDEFFYFYQEGSDHKFMRAEYEFVRNFPPFIEAPLLEMEGFQHNEQTAKRYKFLDHIPLNSDIKFAQIEMRDFLSSIHYTKLSEEIDKHHQLNKTKELTSKPHRKGSHKKPHQKESDDLTGSFPPVQFNPSPTELKLNDTEAYPELGGQVLAKANSTQEPSWWMKELAAVPNEWKVGINKDTAFKPKPKEDKKVNKKPKEEDENYLVAEGSNEMSLGDFISFASVKKTKKKHK